MTYILESNKHRCDRCQKDFLDKSYMTEFVWMNENNLAEKRWELCPICHRYILYRFRDITEKGPL